MAAPMMTNHSSLQDEAGRQVRSDAYGNINYGYMMAMYGVPLELSLGAANG